MTTYYKHSYHYTISKCRKNPFCLSTHPNNVQTISFLRITECEKLVVCQAVALSQAEKGVNENAQLQNAKETKFCILI